ncbi:coproporphyrinogen III oxidase [Roseovarius sp. HI0049]|nr:coproporphyrinogen III oxidase [Roseovarius sp. HI0049]
MTEDWQHGGFGLYIHWPFCEAKCPYCDFNSHVSRAIDQERWRQAYVSELDRYAEMLPHRVLNTVYFGGGTPSLMAPDVVGGVIEKIRQCWPTSNDLEITLEANPGSVEAGRFAAYADAGVSRVSMGIQALNDVDLRRLGRVHSVDDARQAFDIARKNFARISFDLIYARQDQTVSAWRRELEEALSMAVDHLSLYQLTIEPGTAFGDRFAHGGLRGLPDDQRAGDMYEVTQDVCGAAGLPAYEVSNHAAPGAESRHNLVYWRYGDYVGIGPGAHGRITIDGQRYATEGFSQPGKWLDAVVSDVSCETAEPIEGYDQADEYLMMGLRISEGIDARRYKAMSGKDLSADALARLEDLGMIRQNRHEIRATKQGRLVLNAVIKELLAD